MKLRTLDDRMFPLAPETREEWEREREEIREQERQIRSFGEDKQDTSGVKR